MLHENIQLRGHERNWTSESEELLPSVDNFASVELIKLSRIYNENWSIVGNTTANYKYRSINADFFTCLPALILRESFTVDWHTISN